MILIKMSLLFIISNCWYLIIMKQQKIGKNQAKQNG